MTYKHGLDVSIGLGNYLSFQGGQKNSRVDNFFCASMQMCVYDSRVQMFSLKNSVMKSVREYICESAYLGLLGFLSWCAKQSGTVPFPRVQSRPRVFLTLIPHCESRIQEFLLSSFEPVLS